MFMNIVLIVSAVLILIVLLVLAINILSLRRVVPVNEVHIVQTNRSTISYGNNMPSGNTYYKWPAWIPILGRSATTLPISIFDVDLINYESFDQGRLPFEVDVKAFFRVSDSNMAANRVASFEELKDQLNAVVQGAVRSILAKSDIEEILEGRSKFGDDFTSEVKAQITSWGVEVVKNIELMDIRDSKTSKSISFIMEKKRSLIEADSRTATAENNRRATTAEIDARQQIELRNQESHMITGLKQVEATNAVKISQEKAEQDLKVEQKVTTEKALEVEQVQKVKTAEIEKQVEIVRAEQDKATKQTISEGILIEKQNESKGVQAEGEAKAEAEKAMQLAPVQAQITLAKEIGENKSYQEYLTKIREVEATEKVGMEQARALVKAEVKIICNTGTVQGGLNKLGDIFSAKGGTEVGAMLEALANTPVAKSLLEKAQS
jgi:flotillin